MNKQFTASEVRTESCKQGQLHRQPASDMLNAYADMLEARERAAPVAWLRDSGTAIESEAACVTNTVRNLWLASNPKRIERYTIPLYTHPSSPGAERLAEAMERTARHRAAADGIDPDQWRSVLYGWEDRALAAHSAPSTTASREGAGCDAGTGGQVPRIAVGCCA